MDCFEEIKCENFIFINCYEVRISKICRNPRNKCPVPPPDDPAKWRIWLVWSGHFALHVALAPIFGMWTLLQNIAKEESRSPRTVIILLYLHYVLRRSGVNTCHDLLQAHCTNCQWLNIYINKYINILKRRDI